MLEAAWIVNVVAAYVAIAVVLVSTAPSDWQGQYALKGLVGLLWPFWGFCGMLLAPFLAVGWLGERLGDWARARRN